MKIDNNKIEQIDPFYKLDNEDKKNIFCLKTYNEDFIKKDNKIYHKKRTSLDRTVNEILGEMISDYFDLNTVHSKIYKDKFNYYYLLTEVFTKENNKYGYLNKNLFPDFKLYENLNNLNNLNIIYDKEYNKYYNISYQSFENIKLNLKKLIIRDFLTNTLDRWYANIMFKYDKSNIELMPIFDYELSFKEAEFSFCNNIFSIDLNNNQITDYIRNDYVFQELFEKAMLLNIKYYLKKLKNDYYIDLNSKEKWNYINVIKERQRDIKTYKLIK